MLVFRSKFSLLTILCITWGIFTLCGCSKQSDIDSGNQTESEIQNEEIDYQVEDDIESEIETDDNSQDDSLNI